MKTPVLQPSVPLVRRALTLLIGLSTLTSSGQEKPTVLPNDFALTALTKASGSVELIALFRPAARKDSVLKAGAELSLSSAILSGQIQAGKNLVMSIGQNGQEATLKNNRDAVAGLHGHGLSVEQTSGRFYWKPESFACYRDGSLLGVWDVKASSFRPASTDEAPVDFTQITLEPKPVEKPAPKIPTEKRVWTDNKGRKIEGRVLNYNVATRMLSLETSSGQVFRNYPMANLSAEDQAYLKSLFPASAQ